MSVIMEFLSDIHLSSSEESLNHYEDDKKGNVMVIKEQWFIDGPHSYETLKAKGDLKFLNNDYENSILAYQEALVLLPSSYGALKRDISDGLIRALVNSSCKDNWMRALHLSESLFDQANNDDQKFNSCQTKAICHRKLCQYEEDLVCRQSIVDYNPNNASGWLELGITYALLHDCGLLDGVIGHDHSSYCTNNVNQFHSENYDIIYFCMKIAMNLSSHEAFPNTILSVKSAHSVSELLERMNPSLHVQEYLKGFSEVLYKSEGFSGVQFEIISRRNFVSKWFKWLEYYI